MRLPDDLAILHQPVRLGVMAVLHRSRRVRLAALRDALQVTDGNLATHLRTLSDAGYVRLERTWSHDGKQAFVQLTSEGAAALLRYAQAMTAWLAQVASGDEEEKRKGKRMQEDA